MPPLSRQLYMNGLALRTPRSRRPKGMALWGGCQSSESALVHIVFTKRVLGLMLISEGTTLQSRPFFQE
jgi:hypothetical protein